MERFFGALPKILTFVVVAVILLRGIRQGYFYSLLRYLQKFSIGAYRRLFLAIILGLTVLFLLDSRLLPEIRECQRSLCVVTAELGGNLGRHIHPWMILVAAYLLLSLFRLKARFYILGSLFSAAVAAALTLPCKFLFLRARPYAEQGPFSFFNWSGFIHDARAFQSFSSGDVAIVAGASCYFFYLFRNHAFRWFFLLLPLMTAFARTYANKHWPSDGWLGLGLGLLAAKFVSDYETFKRKEKEPV